MKLDGVGFYEWYFRPGSEGEGRGGGRGGRGGGGGGEGRGGWRDLERGGYDIL